MSALPTTVDLTINGSRADLVLTPAREGKPPTLNHAVLDALDTRLAEIEQRADALRLVVVRSASERFFCVGADIQALSTIDVDTIGDWVRHGHRVFNRLEDLPVPVVARVDGFALGGGLELALACDCIYAADTAKVGQTETALGFITGWGGAARLAARIGPGHARELLFAGRVLEATDAAALGLIDRCASAEAIDAALNQFQHELEEAAPEAVCQMKQLMRATSTVDRTVSLEAEVAGSIRCLQSEETRRRLADFLAKRRKA
ncbi:MAG: enoyl-CoA hydratase/isomerase family protein [Opitutales bacterium]